MCHYFTGWKNWSSFQQMGDPQGSICLSLSDCIRGNLSLSPAVQSNADFLRCMTKFYYREHKSKNCVTTIAIWGMFPMCQVQYMALTSFSTVFKSGKANIFSPPFWSVEEKGSFLFRLQVDFFPLVSKAFPGFGKNSSHDQVHHGYLRLRTVIYFPELVPSKGPPAQGLLGQQNQAKLGS